MITKTFEMRQQVYDEGVLVLSALCSCLGQGIEPYVNTLGPYIVHGLKSKEPSLTRLSCGLVSDITTALQSNVRVHLDELVPQLIEMLEDKSGDKQVKLTAITALGDLCMHGGSGFLKYTDKALNPLSRAIKVAGKTKEGLSEEQLVYYNDLRNTLIECLTAILFGLGETGNSNKLLPYLEIIWTMLRTSVLPEVKPSLNMHRSVALLMGDLVSSFRAETKVLSQQDHVPYVVNVLSQTQNEEYIEAAKFLQEVITKT